MDDTSKNTNRNYPYLSFIVNENLVAGFLLLLQRGFMIRAQTGFSVREFLRNEIGAGPETIEKIQSVFLEGRPVDDLDLALVREGSTLALSAAMPGLVGATMRRGGTYSSLRGTITYKETAKPCVKG